MNTYYLLTIATEEDGHAGAQSVIIKKGELHKTLQLLTTEDEETLYKETHTHTCSNGAIQIYYNGEYGEMSVLVTPFDKVEEVLRRVKFTRTG